MTRILAVACLILSISTAAQADAATFSTALKDAGTAEKVSALVEGLEGDEKGWVSWVVESGGVEGPASQLNVDGAEWTYYSTCRTHMCDEQAIGMITNAGGDVFLKLYGSDVAGSQKILGAPPAAVEAALLAQ